MQYPTLQNVRIRSTRDALQVFHAVATHRLPLITRRLDAEERRNIVPGNVYVWYALNSKKEFLTYSVQGRTRREFRTYRPRYGAMVRQIISQFKIHSSDWNKGRMGWDGVRVVRFLLLHPMIYLLNGVKHQEFEMYELDFGCTFDMYPD